MAFLWTFLAYETGRSGISIDALAALWAGIGSGSLAVFAAVQAASNSLERGRNLAPHLMLMPWYQTAGVLSPFNSFEVTNLGPGIAARLKGRMGYLYSRDRDIVALRTIKGDSAFRPSEVFDVADYLPVNRSWKSPWAKPVGDDSFMFAGTHWNEISAVAIRVWCQDLDESFGADAVAVIWREPKKDEWKVGGPHERVVLGKALKRS